MNFTLFLTALLTGLGFVAIVTILARLLAPLCLTKADVDVFIKALKEIL